jgi:hypothetical protein
VLVAVVAVVVLVLVAAAMVVAVVGSPVTRLDAMHLPWVRICGCSPCRTNRNRNSCNPMR